ncbi:hypothetical protein G6F68_011906 [Rhizopus microsporus]|nr:hypothetical protein G6F68_011906 [Rhizopus microsporus]
MGIVNEGADLLDVGGESTRPGAAPVSIEEELRRVIPVIEQLAARPTVPISIAPFKPEVMRAAVAAGAGMIDAIFGLRQDAALDAAAEAGVPVILMHMQGEPGHMQADPHYDDVVAEVHGFLVQRLFAAEMAGIPKKNLLVDLGFGFGKTTAHNMTLLARSERFLEMGVPMLAGLSRKRSLGELTGRDTPSERVAASVAAHLIAVQRGARIVRVHDVAATVDALKIWRAVEAVPTPRTDAAPSIRWPDED